ncbi:ABC transporter ATP-binding protein [Sphingobacterium griseoflavum]|uniref:ABC transporter ATP-binding protein n=2 Tax=Sphingobacterium griseoflavum TaxID=1474952 RepID=A0ABQ3HU50_9SPHI|nr:ABC transporter ATP-binding protein [Sphingobacterium griseoflavum]
MNIINGAQRIGLKSRAVKCSFKQLLQAVPYPCIAHWKESHFVVVYKATKKYIYISDPAKGKLSIDHKSFIKKWIQTGTKKGVVIGLEPEINFFDINLEEDRRPQRSVTNLLNYFAPYKSNIINLLVIMFLVTGLQATLPFLSRSIIDIGVGTSDVNFINIMLFANVGILLATTFSNAVRDWIILHLTSRINISLISDYLIKLMRLPITFFENKMIGDILQRASDHQRIREFIMGNSLNLIFSTMTFIVFAIILGSFNKTIFLLFLAGSLLYFFWVIGFLAIRRRLDTNYFSLMAQDQSYWVETVSGMQDVKINNYENAKRWKWENLQARLYKVNLKLTSVTNYQNQGGQFIEGLKNVLITIFCARSVVNGEMTFGVMISTQIIIGMLNAPIQQFIQFIISAQTAKISLLRINEIHQLENEETQASFNEVILPDNKDIYVRGVYYSYAPKTPYILKDIKLKIPEGKVTAIVGDSGSGKSTLLKMILRLYQPSQGEITLGSLNINTFSLHDWRSRCGVVLQDGKIFNDTVINNIIMGDEVVDYDRFRMAVSTAHIDKEIEALPKGYQTKMGEQGRGLSGGQKQRILIARALYKNPDFLFLDEATNSLDTINERRIVEALSQSFVGRTVVVIAHRLSTIKNADQIVVMKDGRIIEVGNHATLMERNGYYGELVNTQLTFALQE